MNLAGVEVIIRMNERMRQMEDEMQRLRQELQSYRDRMLPVVAESDGRGLSLSRVFGAILIGLGAGLLAGIAVGALLLAGDDQPNTASGSTPSPSPVPTPERTPTPKAEPAPTEICRNGSRARSTGFVSSWRRSTSAWPRRTSTA